MTNMTSVRRTISASGYSGNTSTAQNEHDLNGRSSTSSMQARFELPEYLCDSPVNQVDEGRGESGTFKFPIPTCLNERDKCSLIALSRGNLRAAYNGHGRSDSEAAVVRSNYPIPPQCGIFYFEITVVSKGRDGFIGMGICGPNVSLNRLPGWEVHSWGYHADDGNMFTSSGSGKPYGPTYTTGDVVGCCINFRDRTIFYTKNGISLGVAFRDIPSVSLYACVGMRTPGEIVQTNFGAKPFMFDIALYVADEIAKCHASLAMPVEEKTVHRLVAEYLVHSGFKGTIEAFKANTASSCSFASEKSMDIRNEITQLIMGKNIAGAIKILGKHFPSLLENGSDLSFKLLLLQYVSIISSLQSTSTDDPRWKDVLSILQELKRPGISRTKEREEMIQNFVALVAYPDLRNNPYSHLISDSLYVETCAEVNGAILGTEGFHKSSLLERLSQQLVHTRQTMIDEGLGSSRFVNAEFPL